MISQVGYYPSPRTDFPELFNLIRESGPVGGRALDVGCGVGHLGSVLLSMGFTEVWGVEPNRDAAHAAEERLTRVIHGPFPAQALRDAGPFDLVLMADSLEHIHDPWSALQEVRSLLTPSGRLVLSVPNISHFSVIVGLLHGDWTYAESGLLDATHVRFFTPSSLEHALSAAGFVLSRRTSVRSLPRPVLAPVAWLAGLLMPHLLVCQSLVVASPLR